MKKVIERIILIFEPLKVRRSQKIFMISAVAMALIYFGFTVGVYLLSLRPFPPGNVLNTIFFAMGESFLSYTLFDLLIVASYSIVGGLLYANYYHWKCKTNPAANTGLLMGLVAATACPACALPLLGLGSVFGFLTAFGVYLKLGILAVLIGSMYYVAITQSKKSVCEITV